MSYEASIHTQTSVLPSGKKSSLTFTARGFGEDETPRLGLEISDGDYSFSSMTVHLDEVPVDRIRDMVRSLRKATDDIETWNDTRASSEEAT